MIPAEAVEAAAKASWEKSNNDPWISGDHDDLRWADRRVYLDDAKVMLEAAAPYMFNNEGRILAMGTERREGKPFTVDGTWWTEETRTHALEVHRASDTVTYYVNDEREATFTVEQFEDLMRMASTIDYLKQPQEWEAPDAR